jgi:hypothetical protein
VWPLPHARWSSGSDEDADAQQQSNRASVRDPAGTSRIAPCPGGGGAGAGRSSQRLAGVCGLIFVALTAVPLLVAPPPPPSGALAADVVADYSTHRTALLFGGWLAATGIVPSFVFLARLVAIVRDLEDQPAWLWLVALFGLIGAFACVLALTALGAVLPYSAAGAGPAVARALSDLLGLTFAVYFFPIAVFFAAVGRVLTTTRGFPRWLGAGAYLVAAAALPATLGMFAAWTPLAPGGVYSLAAFSLQVLWWLAASAVLLLRPVAPDIALA